VAERRLEKNFLNNKEKEKWIKDDMERETAVARKRVEDAETPITLEQEDMRSVKSGRLTSKEPRQMFEWMLGAIGDSLSDLASSDDEENGEDDQDTAQGKLREDDDPGRVMGTISKMIQQRMERFCQMQMKLDELTQHGWGDEAHYFRERHKQYISKM
jgi:hypothetical protein